jgi:hypothetical protein
MNIPDASNLKVCYEDATNAKNAKKRGNNDMKANTYQETATIIPFPGRFGAKNGKNGNFLKNGTEENTTKICIAAESGSWYHLEAIRDAEHAPKN